MQRELVEPEEYLFNLEAIIRYFGIENPQEIWEKIPKKETNTSGPQNIESEIIARTVQFRYKATL